MKEKEVWSKIKKIHYNLLFKNMYGEMLNGSASLSAGI